MAGVGRMVKETIIRDTAEALKQRPNLFITSISGIAAAEVNTFRQRLNASQSRLIMIKRSLGLRTVSTLKLAGLDSLLEGSIGFVFSGEDALAVAKTLVEFGKAHEEQVKIRGAVIDGLLLDARAVKTLADLPPKPVLLAQVLGTIEAPITDVIFTLERLIGDLAWIAEEASKTKPQAAAAAEPKAGEKPQAEPLPAPEDKGQAGPAAPAA